MTQEIEKQILQKLGSVRWAGEDIVSRGMVLGVTLSADGAKASVVIQVGPEKDGDLEGLQREVERAVGAVSGIGSVAVVLTAHQAAPQRQPHRPQKIELPQVKYVVAVASGKGGVGKSTTSVNLAAALMQQGLKTGLMDADIYGPSIPRMLGVSGKPAMRDDKMMIPHRRFGLSVMSMGFLVPEEAPMVWRGPMVHAAITQLFRDVDWGELDILVVDLPPGTGDAQLTMAQSAPLSGAVIVSTPQDIALLDARKGLAMFQKVDIPVLGLVENMSYFLCPHCGGRSDIFSHGGARHEAERLNIPFLGEIPLDIEVRLTSDQGQPVTLSNPDSPLAERYRGIAANLWRSLNA